MAKKDFQTRNYIGRWKVTRTFRARLYLRVLLSLLGGSIFPSPGQAQDEPETKETILHSPQPADGPSGVEQAVRRFALRFDNEISFLLPEGELNLAFEKRVGSFLAQSRARYNFVRGELGFSLRNIYTRYRVVPEVQVYDNLNFVPLFEKDRLWRREQGVQIGGRFFPRVPLATFTGYNYERLSFPSSINVRSLESKSVHSIAQGFSGRVDSLNFLGLRTSGIFELQLAKSLLFLNSDFNFWQFRLSTHGSLVRGAVSLRGRFRLISLLAGRSAPPQFLGGRDKLSGYGTNEFSGINLVYTSLSGHVRLKKRSFPLLLNLYTSELSVAGHLEFGQVGDEPRVLDRRHYHASIGAGIDGMISYRQGLALELFLFWYHGLEPGRDSKYYVGIKF